MKRIPLGKVPNRQRQFSPRLQHPQHFAHAVQRRRKEHHAKPANHRIKRIRRKRQRIRRRHLKLRILYRQPLRRSPRRLYHSSNRIDPTNSSFRPHHRRNTQRRFPWPCRNIENRLPAPNSCIGNKPPRYLRKHLPDNFPVLLPIRSRSRPSIDSFLVLLHEEKYIPATCAYAGTPSQFISGLHSMR